MVERSRSERKGTCSSLKETLVWRGVWCCFPCSAKEDTSGSLELIKDLTFYKHMLKLVMCAEKRMHRQGFNL